LTESPAPLDDLDLTLIRLLRTRQRVGAAELARLVGVARNTVLSRLRRLEDRHVITGYGPDVDARAAGYGVQAFTTLSIAQGAHERAVAALCLIPEILEIHTITGRGDLLVRIAAPTNDILHVVLQHVAAIPEVGRTETQLALHTSLVRTVADVIAMTSYRRPR
jgi:DNA-binding Lrp family transcriptional regulator